MNCGKRFYKKKLKLMVCFKSFSKTISLFILEQTAEQAKEPEKLRIELEKCENKTIDTSACPYWGDWTEWTSCEDKCGSVSISRQRQGCFSGSSCSRICHFFKLLKTWIPWYLFLLLIVTAQFQSNFAILRYCVSFIMFCDNETVNWLKANDQTEQFFYKLLNQKR